MLEFSADQTPPPNRRELEQQLAETVGLLEDHARHVPGILYQTRGRPDGTGFCVPVIRGRTQEYLGYSPAEIQARPLLLLEAIHPDDWPSCMAAGKEAMHDGRPFALEFRVVSRSGKVRWLSVSSQPHTLPCGDMVFNGVGIDITRRKQMEDELRQTRDELDDRVRQRTAELSASEQRFRQLAEIIEEVFWIATSDKRKILYVSPAYETVFCQTCQSLYDDPISFINPVHEDDRQKLLEWQPQTPGEMEFRIVRPTGEVRWVWTHAFPVYDELGAVCRVVGITRDITARKRNEERLRNEEQLLRKMLALQDRERKLVAHEIHDGVVQYITGCKMIVDGLRHQVQTGGKLKPDDLAAVGDLLAKALGEGRRLISNLRPLIIDEEGLLEAINYLVAEETSRGLIAISFTHAVTFEHLPPLLETALFRIVQEALTNIRRHSRAQRADIRLVQDEGQIRLEVRDDGIGFDPQRIPEDRFGIRGIIERARLFGGSATIRSQTGRGTLVSVVLPLDLEAEE